jgi:hypothetical protein
MRIDGVTRWSAQTKGASVNQTVDVTGLTGVHSIEFRCELITPGNDQSQWFSIDNVRTLAPAGYLSTGTLTSTVIAPSPLARWGVLHFTRDVSGAGTALTVDVLNASGTLLAANVPNGTDLNAFPAIANQPSIRLRANLSTTNLANTPRLDDWSVAWKAVADLQAQSVWSPFVTSIQDASAPVVTVTNRVTTMPFIALNGLIADAAGVASFTLNGVSVQTSDNFRHWTTPLVYLLPGWNTFPYSATDSAVPPNTVNGNLTIFLTTPNADTDLDGMPDMWEAEHGLDPFSAVGDAGARGDLDKDGLCNMLERAFGLDPSVPGTNGWPATSVETNPDDGLRYFVLRYRRLLSPGALVYAVETSEDFVTWSSDAANQEQIGSPAPTGDGLTEAVTVRIKPALGTDGHPANYIHVRVTSPTP